MFYRYGLIFLLLTIFYFQRCMLQGIFGSLAAQPQFCTVVHCYLLCQHCKFAFSVSRFVVRLFGILSAMHIWYTVVLDIYFDGLWLRGVCHIFVCTFRLHAKFSYSYNVNIPMKYKQHYTY